MSKQWEFQIIEQGNDWPSASGICFELEDAQREGAHYAMQYAQDGDVTLKIFQVEKVEYSSAIVRIES